MNQAMQRLEIRKHKLRLAPKADSRALHGLIGLLGILCCALGASSARAQQTPPEQNSAGNVPAITGAFAYIQNSNGGVQTLEPQIDPVLLVPIGNSLLLESHVEFTGVFARQNFQSGPYVGKVFKTIESAQLDWLADSHVTVVAGRYYLPFGLFNERLSPVWIHNLQDFPLTFGIGTAPYGFGDGFMLRGVLASTPAANFQYTAYMSAHSSINQLPAERAAGGDGSIFWPSRRVETGLSYQRTLEGYQINNEAAYLTWQPQRAAVDLKAEYDRNHYGNGYWIEAAHSPQQFFVAPDFFRRAQLVGRMEQFFVRNGGGHGLATVDQQRPEVGINYLIHDDWKLVSSYGRLFSKSGNSNTWNFGFTYRFVWPLWPGKKS
jgi:hypothetical protein